MDSSGGKQTVLFGKDYKSISFVEYEAALSDYFSQFVVSEIDFKKFWVLKKCRGDKYFMDALKRKESPEDLLYFGLSQHEAKNFAEDNRETGTYFRLMEWPCLTIKCGNYYLAFLDLPHNRYRDRRT